MAPIPFVPAAKQFLRTIEEENINVTCWAAHVWSAEWCNSASRLPCFIPDARPHPPGLALSRPVWTGLNYFCTRLNYLHTSVGRFLSSMHKWEWPLQWSVSVVWRIKLQTISYQDANIHHQMASVVCRSWITSCPNIQPGWFWTPGELLLHNRLNETIPTQFFSGFFFLYGNF